MNNNFVLDLSHLFPTYKKIRFWHADYTYI